MSEYWNQTLRLLSFTDANVQYVFAGMILLGVVGGVLGSFAVLRKRALIGDALAHAALPGIGLAFLITATKSIGVLLIGAYLAGVAGVLIIIAIRKFSKIKEDAALAIVLSVFFGIGIVLLTYIQKTGMGAQAGLDKFLFGQSASLVMREVKLTGVIAVILITGALLFKKEITLLCFDPSYANSIGFSATLLDVILMGMIVGVVVIGLQAVGVVLMAALLIIPPVTARFWTDRIDTMILLSAIVGALSGMGGGCLSFMASKMPSGPLTVLFAAFLFLISLLVAPNRGLITKAVNRAKLSRKTNRDNSLRLLAEYFEVSGKNMTESFTINEIAEFRGAGEGEIRGKLSGLKNLGFTKNVENGKFVLTQAGVEKARAVLKRHRLWELYLIHQADIAADHVHRDADESEHFLTPEIEAQLEKITGINLDKLISPHPISYKRDSHV